MEPLTTKIQDVVEKLPPDGVTLREIVSLVGQDGLMILIAFLSLIFIIPVSVPGVSTVFGAAILMMSISRLFNRDLWLPASFQNRIISTEKLLPVFRQALTWLRRLETVSRPHRMKSLASNGLMGLLNNLSLILGAILLMAPFGLIPLSNTLPALALLFFAVGIVQRDGVCILLGHAGNVCTIVYFSILIGGGGLAFRQAWLYYFG
ncbi:exopolysaccharide biosynthesis protein [Noviherbaspirillum sp. Root189]|uniref:exopolysaccharide biosynthesis protein n=1 Tax=Noviherbaspirillum sp. Root189 TaxID=1736487 RepID=UPI00070CF4F2|nr:exopolysaccharide biosynthesis protein [Noviherbaspirillum sp. Root189]KRB67903.1 exopolysaccharide biosynthesis protein [Noviherbaspirillum sp. Root189]